MRETKGLGEDIHFRLGLSGDTTEKNTTPKGRESFHRSNVEPAWGLLPLKGQHMETKPVSQRPIIKAKPRVSRYH